MKGIEIKRIFENYKLLVLLNYHFHVLHVNTDMVKMKFPKLGYTLLLSGWDLLICY